MRRAGLGVVIGVLLALPLSRALQAITFGVDATDPATFAVVAATLLGVAFIGTWLPARRAARLDPLRALAAD
jgi:ABC-type antimicrobial peptide transport system permease subunit